MPVTAIDPSCFLSLPLDEQLQQIYLQLDTLTGASDADDAEYTSNPHVVTTSGSIPAGVRGWSFTAISGTVTFNGDTVPNGADFSGGGYGNARSSAALAYTIAGGGSALVSYDT